LIAEIGQPPQPLVDIEKPRLAAHRFASRPVNRSESEAAENREVRRSVQLSATIAAFCSAVETHRRPAPVKISSRCAGRETFDPSIRSEIDTCRSLIRPDYRPAARTEKGALSTPLTHYRQ
jgi:hypothetical protein